MVKHFSSFAILISILILVGVRLNYRTNNSENGYNATSWDAFGYYMYLPAIFIYNDVTQLSWVDSVDQKYRLTGGQFYQAIYLEEQGGYTNKYLIGVACLELPYFLFGHTLAGILDYPQDGFSAPYQYAILTGAILSVLIGLLILRNVLKHYFSDNTVGFTLIFLVATTNLVQYASIDGGMSHAYIFPLYALLLWLTIRWHESYQPKHVFFIGFTIALATISRPTELIMIFIPLLWKTGDPQTSNEKWKKWKRHKEQLVLGVLGGFLGVLPQLLYWKYTTGSFVFDVGSKWYFLNPWFRVLFGTEKGWFLYTPIAIAMVIGLFISKNSDFKRSLLTFSLLNIWIIIAWSDWRYGASYSTRALVQSLPVFAFGIATMIERFAVNHPKRIALAILLIALAALNGYQMQIYNSGVLESFSPFIAQSNY